MKLHPLYQAILCCSLSVPGYVLAQAADGREIEEIVVTGSLIRGTPEDAALPVETFDEEYFRLSGNPGTLEFMRSLSSIGETMGQVNSFGQSYSYGLQRFNVRNLGGEKTLTMINGRRANQDTTFIPTMAIQRVEVLKDGAAVTYGADAVGGVVNFITRENFEGFEVSADYSHIQDTDGDYKLSMLGGWNTDNGNVLVGAEYQEKSELSTRDREWSMRPYSENPSSYSVMTDATQWLLRSALGTTVGYVPEADQELCDAMGVPYTSGMFCQFNYGPTYNLQENQSVYKFFVQANGSLSDTTSYHVDLNYGRSEMSNVHSSPVQPVTQGPAPTPGLTGQFYVPSHNPGFATFLNQSVADGKISPLLASVANEGVAQYFRPFAFQGNPAFGNDSGSNEHQRYSTNVRFNAELDGAMTDTFAAPVLGNDIYWNASATYSQTTTELITPDIVGFKYQDALDGYGGPNCYNTNDERRALDGNFDTNRIDGAGAAAPGENGCMYINPFTNAWSHDAASGYQNPNYVPGTETSQELAEWLMDDRHNETAGQAWTIDLVFSGELPVQLPGGNIGWAFGSQWREEESRYMVYGDYHNENIQPCAYPDQDFITDAEYNSRFEAAIAGGATESEAYSALQGYCSPANARGAYTFNPNAVPYNTQQSQYSFFTQVDLPITDSFNVSLALRDETFSGGLSASVYKVSTKWQATDWFGIRASYGDNYAAPPVGLRAGDITSGLIGTDAVDGAYIPVRSITDSGIEPETAISWNVGLLFNGEGFTDNSSFNATIDYYTIELKDEIVSLDHNSIANSTLLNPADQGDSLVNCSAPLIGNLTFIDGDCVQGVTTGADIVQVDRPRTNGPSRDVSGIDLNVDYSMDMFSGVGTLGTSASYTREYTIAAFRQDGIEYSPEVDAVGYGNYGRPGPTVPEWRGNLFANYRLNDHNLRLVYNYISSVKDDRISTTTTFGSTVDAWKSFDLHYTVDEVVEGLTLSASVVNLTDQEPPQARMEYSYDPLIGNPLGRIFKVSATKRF